MKAYRETIAYMYGDNPQVIKDYAEFAGVSEVVARRVREDFFPRALVEPDEIDFRRGLDLCRPYLGPLVGQYTDWTPLSDRERLFAEDLDKSDPWQFKNVRVS